MAKKDKAAAVVEKPGGIETAGVDVAAAGAKAPGQKEGEQSRADAIWNSVCHAWRKKPVVVEARQWTGQNAVPLLDWIGSDARQDGQTLIIHTLEGDHEASLGDWIIRGVKGEFYPCKPDIFAATYEAADAAPSSLPDVTEPTAVPDVAAESTPKPLTETALTALDIPTQIAFYAAANALLLHDRTADSMRWPYHGFLEGFDDLAIDMARMARFVRHNPTAPPEALWRYAHGQGIHASPADGFHGAARLAKLPYKMFAAVLKAADLAEAEQVAEEQARAQAAAPPPVAGPSDVRGTMREQHGSVLDPSFDL